jgi:non-canonical purine NTP pyrophosphatase (RdgB/HAM1 family)
MKPQGILETALYAPDLDASRRFYEEVLGFECLMAEEGRDAFFRCGNQMLLLFNPDKTAAVRPQGPGVAPPHGAHGPGHLCFRASLAEIDIWRERFENAGVVIDADFLWSNGARSLYIRDPAGNCIEFAEPKLWEIAEPVRSVRGAKLVAASHNPGKLREIEDLLGPHGVVAVSSGALGLTEPEETAPDFAGNAIIKSEAAARASGLVAISDDSGLCVDALDGAPGVHSARWAGPSKDFALAMRNVEEKLQAIPGASRRAQFISALAVTWPDGATQVFEGRVDGTLVWPPRGTKGFGYDPMFVPDGHAQTFGEMEPAVKHGLSHRARAFKLLADALL